jgi:hypothetical protein
MNTQTIVIVGVVVLLMFVLWSMCPRTSTFTLQTFENLKSAAEVTASFRLQTQQIADELKTELIKAKTEKKTKEDIIAIADRYSDYSCELSKSYARWNINNSMI